MTEPTESSARLVATVHGVVQGVGFRYFTRGVLDQLGLTGTAVNQPDGTVEVTATGPDEALQSLVRMLQGPRAPGHVERVDVRVDRG